MNREYKDMPYYPSRLPGSVTRRLFQLDAGALIRFQNRPWRIIEINERAFDIWPEEDQQRFHASPEGKRGEDPATWIRRTVAVLLQPDRQPKARIEHYGCSLAASLTVLPEHYALCHICGELPPCRDALIDIQVEESAQAMERMMAIPAGCCLGCGEPVTSRMKAHRFPGPNLWRPDLGDGSAVFHARKACFDQAFHYDEKWAEAAPGRRRRFQCDGH